MQENNQQKCWVLYFSYKSIFISKVFLHDGKKRIVPQKNAYFGKEKTKNTILIGTCLQNQPQNNVT